MSSTPPLVSVCLITYNHVKYISQAIEGVLLQEKDFEWEMIIADDCSSDGTTQIVIDYQNKYPDHIKLVLQSQNVGAGKNWLELMAQPQGKYIAYFEADDYWIDPMKLKKQLSILEQNSGISLCYHRAKELSPDGVFHEDTGNTSLTHQVYTIEQLAKGNFIHTPTAVFRNHLIGNYPDWILQVPFGDYVSHMLNAMKGDIYYLPDIMAVYRSGIGTYSSLNEEKQLLKWEKTLTLLLTLDFNQETRQHLKDTLKSTQQSLRWKKMHLFYKFRGFIYQRSGIKSIVKYFQRYVASFKR